MSPNAGEGERCGVSANEYSCAHGAQINFGDLTLYLTYALYYLLTHTLDNDSESLRVGLCILYLFQIVRKNTQFSLEATPSKT
jgi:hypothetical protein